MAAIQATNGVVSRYGDTLVVRLGNGRVITEVDTPWNGEVSNLARYLGMLRGHDGEPDFHIVGYGDGESFSASLVDARSGDTLALPNRPIPSPDGTRFLAHATDQSSCTGELGIWRRTHSMPVREWSAEELSCDTRPQWELADPAWRSADTVTFRRDVVSKQTKRWVRDSLPSFLVRSPSGWALDTVTAAALARTPP